MRGRQLPNKNKLLKGWYFEMTKKTTTTEKETINYGFYSKVLQKPFDSLSELKAAEDVYYSEQKAKEDKAAQKKADAQKVEDALKALNAARKTYKENLAQLTKEYAESLEDLKKAFELGKKDIHDSLAAAEDAFDAELKKFADTYGQYHFTLKGDDFETTVSGSSMSTVSKQASNTINDIWNLFLGQ